MARRMSKKAKAEAYDALHSEAELMRLMLHDIGTDKEPDATADAVEPDPYGGRDNVHVSARAWRLTGAAGGIVLLTVWTVDSGDGHESCRSTYTRRLDDIDRTGSRRSGWERAMAAVARQLKDARKTCFREEHAEREARRASRIAGDA